MGDEVLSSDDSDNSDTEPEPEAPPKLNSVQKLRRMVEVAEAECCMPAVRFGKHAAKRADARLVYEYNEFMKPLEKAYKKEVAPRYLIVETKVEERLDIRKEARREAAEMKAIKKYEVELQQLRQWKLKGLRCTCDWKVAGAGVPTKGAIGVHTTNLFHIPDFYGRPSRELKDSRELHRSASRISAGWRGYKGRKEAWDEKQRVEKEEFMRAIRVCQVSL